MSLAEMDKYVKMFQKEMKKTKKKSKPKPKPVAKRGKIKVGKTKK